MAPQGRQGHEEAHEPHVFAREAVLEAREAYIDALHDLHELETRELVERDAYKNCLTNCATVIMPSYVFHAF